MKKIYLISKPSIDNVKLYKESLRSIFSDTALRRHVYAFQLRLKPPFLDNLDAAAAEISEVCEEFGVSFYANDNVEVTLKCLEGGRISPKLAGVHVGKGDRSFIQLKIDYPEMPVGVSCYNNYSIAKNAVAAGVSYISFGAFFETKTKDDTVPVGKDTLVYFSEYKALHSLKYNIAAIGGINPNNATELFDAGAEVVCAISAIHDEDGLVCKKKVECFIEKF